MNAKMLWKIVISVVIAGVSVGNLAQVEAVQCYSCTDCVELKDRDSTVNCDESTCAVWKNSDSKIERGCKPDDVQGVDLKHDCNDGLCNDKTVLVCQTCSANVNDCEDVFCKIEDEGDPKCYISKADSDESRGCKSDLQPASDENEYAFCSTPNCNRVAICVECNSNDDPDCRQGNLDQKDDIKCPNNGVIYEYDCYREEGDDGSLVELGCTSKLPDPEKQESDYFKKCAGDNCNKKAILSCYKCKKCESIVEGETETERCGKYPTSCITYYESDPDTNELKVSRRCTDFLDLNNIEQAGYDFYELCDEEPLCNKKDSANHRKCYQCTDECDTLDDTKLDYCPDMEADFCYILQSENGLIHGCDKDDQAGECKEWENCRKCSTENCNHANPDEIKCFECEGADQCKEPETRTNDCAFYEDCFISWEDGQLTKGCSTPELASSCGEENCELCSESRCNGLHCVQCNSKTNADCITGKGKVGYELCTDAGDKCVAFVNDDGFTVRGCKSSFLDLTCGTDCEFDEPGSNDDLIPEDALQCLHCNELACDLESSTAEYCLSNQNLGCFIKFNGQEVTDRGCVTKEMQCDEDLYCYSCKSESNCNKQLFECNSCSASNADDDCVGDPEKSCKSLTGCVAFITEENKIVRDCVENVQNCPDGTCSPQPTNDQDVCSFAIVDDKFSMKVCESNRNVEKCWRYQKQGEVRMGCNEDKDEICGDEDDHCKACDLNLCNEKEVAECYCTDCGETAIKLCDDPEDRCYTRVEEGQLSRGCSKDLQSEDEAKFCEGPLCNNGWICHSCSTVDGEDCLGDKSKSCTTTSRCVTLLQGNNVVRGCAEDVCNAHQEGCENTCTTEYCNNQDVCYVCDDCNTIETSSLEICSTQQNRACYTRQDLDDRKISRGCVDQQSDEECQEGFNCIVCEGTKCNKDEPMQQARRCSKCDLGNCTNYAPADDCDSIGLLVDQCIEYAPLDVTFYKGCLSNTPQNVIDICLSQSNFCTLCNNDYCNTEELSCYQCSTKESSLECLLNPEKSSLCNPDDSCTTCLDTEGHLHRGCSSDLTEICSAQSEKCTSPDCNKEQFPKGRLECHQCQDCLETPESNIKPCLLYQDNESCYVQVVDESTVHRGCTSGITEPCENCLECSDLNGCNSMGPMQSNTLSCVSCTSNADCEGRAFGSLCQAQILIGRTDSCYTQMFGEFVIAKGCLSDLPPSNPFYEDCMQSSSNCPTCSTPDCNKGKTSCFKCNSADDADCSEIASLKNYETECEAECVTKLDDVGYTVRGCIEDFPEFDKEDCKSSDRCQVCTDKNCNNAVLPENMVRRCYQCEGSDSACLEATMPSMMKACRKYVPGDGCYVRAENATWIARGCLSDLTEEASCDGLCLDCNGNGCNNQPVLKPNSLVCVSCKGADCQGQKEGKRCTEKILLGREDSCYQYDNGQAVQKGCLSDLKLDEESEVKESCETGDEETCKLCNYDACNGEFHYCVSCDSSKDPECAGRIGTVSEALRKVCDVSRCVSRYKDNTTVIKGCASATEPCEKTDPYCSECEGNLCNNIPFPADRILCHQCSGCDDVTAVESAICPKYNPEESCFTRLIDGAIYRGCLSEATVECDEQCFTCNSNGCNNEQSHYDSELSCVHCQGGTQCKEATVDQSKKCQGSVALGETDKCYTLKVGSEVLERGCVVSKQTSCSGLNSCEETTCSCNNCNLADKDKELTCHKCEGKDCGNAISAPGETCKGTACVSYVSRDGIVSRGCLHDYQTMCSIYGNRNSLCFGDQCNGEIYPVGRMTCYQCEGCTSPEESRICERYVENDGCYTLTDGTYVERGCLSDLPLGCSGSECVTCSDPNCNDKEMTTDAPPPVTTPEAGTTSDSGTTPEAGTTPGSGTTTLEPVTQSCIICSETASDQSCAWAFKPSLASTCPVSADDVGCFRCLKDFQAVRGCTADLREDTCDTGLEIYCSEPGCNSASFREQKCAICTRDCDGSKASYTVETCAGDVEYEQRGCYVRRSLRRVVTERGCFANLSEEQRQDCLKNGDACLRCTGDVCNGGARMEAFWAMIFGALAFVIMRVRLV